MQGEQNVKYQERHFILAFCSYKECPKKEIYNTQTEVIERGSGCPKHFHLDCYFKQGGTK